MTFSIHNDYQSYKTYKYNFYNLTDLYNYLISDPEVNSYIFSEQSSIVGDVEFSGASLDKAIEYLNGGYKINFEKFDIAIRDIRKYGVEDVDSRKLERALHGGAYLSHLVAAGVPDCMIRYKQDSDPKHITIYFQLGYPHYTEQSQIMNRGIATINLIQSLEDKGYIVDLKVFELSSCNDEFIDITVNLKNTDEILNISKCYYPFVSKEFLRRLLFRVLESAPVENSWGYGYGRSANNDEIRDFYKLKDRDIVISTPQELGIKGENIYEDTISLFKNLNLDDEFDLSKLKEGFEEKVKVKNRFYY